MTDVVRWHQTDVDVSGILSIEELARPRDVEIARDEGTGIMEYSAPEFQQGAFNCPHCNAYAHMNWQPVLTGNAHAAFWAAFCAKCNAPSLWRIAGTRPAPADTAPPDSGIQIYPMLSPAAMPNVDLPDDCFGDYLEAREIMQRSPRAAAALLRLVIQKLCRHFGEPGRDVNQDIAALVRQGLPVTMQQALDSVRVIGNEAVHPGELDVRDNPEVVSVLFTIVNLIVEKMLTEPRKIAELYQALPPRKLDGIAQRDK
jgi:hypothetical protein